MGPMTGRGMGFCAGNAAPGFVNSGGGMAFGGGRGGMGRRNMFYATGMTAMQRGAMGQAQAGAWGVPGAEPAMTREQELEMLKNQAGYFEDALGNLKRRIDDLQAQEK